jgi:hypothetical protein
MMGPKRLGLLLLADVAVPATTLVLVRHGGVTPALWGGGLTVALWALTAANVRDLRRERAARPDRDGSAVEVGRRTAIATSALLLAAALTAFAVAARIAVLAGRGEVVFVLAVTGAAGFVAVGVALAAAARRMLRYRLDVPVRATWVVGPAFIAATVAADLLPPTNVLTGPAVWVGVVSLLVLLLNLFWKGPDRTAHRVHSIGIH